MIPAMRLFLSLYMVLGAAAWAEEPAQPEGTQPVRVTTFLLSHPGVDDQMMVPAMRKLDDGLKRNPRLEMKDLDTRLAEFAQEVPQEEIDRGKAEYEAGQKALAALDLPVAIKKLTAAIETLSKVLPYIKKAELADAMMALGTAQFEQGDKKQAHRTFVRLITWRNDYKVDVNRYAPSVLDPFETARKEVERAKRGSLDIRSEPGSAQAYVDGKYVGVTPTFAEGLPVGEHFITLKREGYRKAVMPATVSAKFQQVVNINLERSGKYLLVEQALKNVEKNVGASQLDSGIDNLKEVLFVDHAVFVRAKPGAAGMIDLELYLYDLRTRRQLAHVNQSFAVGEEEKTLDPVASNLYLNVSYEAELEAPKDAPIPKAAERKPIWKTWWFWTAAGVIVVGAVVAGVAIAETRPKDCGSGNFCPGFTF
jgi:hypothetical protein